MTMLARVPSSRCDAAALTTMARAMMVSGTIAMVGVVGWPGRVLAQSDDDPQRVERLENQVRQLTGQNEELQYRNRQLEEQLRQLMAGQGAPQSPVPNTPTRPQSAPMQPAAVAGGPLPQPQYQPQPNYQSQQPQPATPIEAPRGRRGDAFDPAANPNAPGVPRALGSGAPVPVDPNASAGAQPGIGAPGGRAPGDPLDLASANPRASSGILPSGGTVLTTLPPNATPKDEFDLGIGYIQRKDYALAEETMRNFVQKYPSDRLVSDAQYWLGESMFQRQRFRDAAETFLNVTTKFETSAKAPDALLRLGQSLAALKEKEAACAAFGEVARKYPRASAGVKQGIDRDQKRVKC